jgi:hypothetical protein
MAKKATAPAPTVATGDVRDLLEFWGQVMKGQFLMADQNGNPKIIPVPLELRLRASQLLAQYTVPGKVTAQPQEDDDVAVTPDVLRLTQLLEQNTTLTDDDLREALDAAETK